MTCIEGKDWIGIRSVYNGKVTDLYINQLADGRLMHLNSWIDADGWTTDAYMLAVTYDEGTDPTRSSEVTLIHGSALKRNGKNYHNSLSKSNLVAEISNGKFKSITTDIPTNH